MLKIFDGDAPSATRLVRERLEFVGIISSLQNQFGHQWGGIRTVNPNELIDPWLHFAALRNHLLLTCFDVLGQPSDYKDYQSWLTASSTAEDRSSALEEIGNSENLIEASAKLHRRYLDSYGTKSSFFRFLEEVIPDETKDDLLRNMLVRRIDIEQHKELEIISESRKKLRILYDIRNVYTHSAVGIGNHVIAPGFSDWYMDDGVPKKGHVGSFFYESGKNQIISVGLRDWPDTLLRAVHAGLNKLEEDLVKA